MIDIQLGALLKHRRLLNIIPLSLFPALLVWINIKLARKSAPHEIEKIFTYKYGDKISHIVVYGAFTFIVLFFGEQLISTQKSALTIRIILSSFLFLAITADEFTQKLIASRSFSYTDLACSYIGFLTAVVLYILIKNVGELIKLKEKQ